MNRKAGRVAGCKTAAPVAAALLLLVAFTLGLCCLGVCRACGDADAGNARAVDALITEFSARNAFEHVRILAEGIGPRPAGSEAERRAAEYIAGELRSYGYSVRIEEFGLPVPEWMREAGSSVETTSLNVVAVRPGKSPSAFVVGAHMDSVSQSPGASDNASGVAVMLEAARVLAKTETAHTVIFAAFGAEEIGLLGSEHFAESDAAKAVLAMISLDMVGHGSRLEVYPWGARTAAHPKLFEEVLQVVGGLGYRWGFDRSYASLPVLGSSDHASFLSRGIPAVFLASPIAESWAYHSPADVTANVSKAALERSGRVALALIRIWDARDWPEAERVVVSGYVPVYVGRMVVFSGLAMWVIDVLAIAAGMAAFALAALALKTRGVRRTRFLASAFWIAVAYGTLLLLVLAAAVPVVAAEKLRGIEHPLETQPLAYILTGGACAALMLWGLGRITKGIRLEGFRIALVRLTLGFLLLHLILAARFAPAMGFYAALTTVMLALVVLVPTPKGKVLALGAWAVLTIWMALDWLGGLAGTMILRHTTLWKAAMIAAALLMPLWSGTIAVVADRGSAREA